MPSEWEDVSRRILEALDIAAEYRSFGIDITGSQPNRNGWLECRAFNREDRTPSAGINVGMEHPLRGRYKEFIQSGDCFSFWDFAALKAGKFATWEEARNHYAEKVGVELPSGKKHAKKPEDSLTFRGFNETLVTTWCRLHKPGIAPGAVRVAGGQIAKWPASEQFTTVAMPVFGEHLTDTDPIGWTVWNLSGRPLPLFQGKDRPAKLVKILNCGGSQAGLFNKWGLDLLQQWQSGKPDSKPELALVWKIEGSTSMLAWQSAIPREQIRNHAVIGNSGGSLEVPRADIIANFRGQRVVTIHDADKDGYAGGYRWAVAFSTVAAESKFVELPIRRTKDHGADIRDLITGAVLRCRRCGGSGNIDGHWTDEETYIQTEWAPGDCPNCKGTGRAPNNNPSLGLPPLTFADVMALANATEPLAKPVGDVTAVASDEEVTGDPDRDTLVERIICQELGIVVDGMADKREAKIWSLFHRRFSQIEPKKMMYEDFLSICGPPARQKLHLGKDDIPGMYRLTQAREAIATLAGYRAAGANDAGQGCWPGEASVEHRASDTIVLVGDGRAATWNGKGELVAHTSPFVAGLTLDLEGSGNWFDFNTLAGLCQQAANDPAWCRQVVVDLMNLFDEWFWKTNTSSQVLAGLTMATWIQTYWEWRPLVSIVGPSHAGKTTLFETLSQIFGQLSLLSSESSEAGIRQAVRRSAQIILCDEFEASHERKKVLKFFRTASRGSTKLMGTSDPKQKGARYGLRHIPWVTAIELSMEREPDRNRFIRLELDRPTKGKKLALPSFSAIADLGQRALAVAVVHARKARRYSEIIRGMTVPGVHGRIVESFSVPIAMLAAALSYDAAKMQNELFPHVLSGFDFESQGQLDEANLMSAILASTVDLGHGERGSVSQLIEDPDSFVGSKSALERHGIAVIRVKGGKMIFFEPSTVRRFLLDRTPWADQSVETYLLRMRGARRTKQRIGGRPEHGVGLDFEVFVEQFMGDGDEGLDSGCSGGGNGGTDGGAGVVGEAGAVERREITGEAKEF